MPSITFRSVRFWLLGEVLLLTTLHVVGSWILPSGSTGSEALLEYQAWLLAHGHVQSFLQASNGSLPYPNGILAPLMFSPLASATLPVIYLRVFFGASTCLIMGSASFLAFRLSTSPVICALAIAAAGLEPWIIVPSLVASPAILSCGLLMIITCLLVASSSRQAHVPIIWALVLGILLVLFCLSGPLPFLIGMLLCMYLCIVPPAALGRMSSRFALGIPPVICIVGIICTTLLTHGLVAHLHGGIVQNLKTYLLALLSLIAPSFLFLRGAPSYIDGTGTAGVLYLTEVIPCIVGVFQCVKSWKHSYISRYAVFSSLAILLCTGLINTTTPGTLTLPLFAFVLLFIIVGWQFILPRIPRTMPRVVFYGTIFLLITIQGPYLTYVLFDYPSQAVVATAVGVASTMEFAKEHRHGALIYISQSVPSATAEAEAVFQPVSPTRTGLLGRYVIITSAHNYSRTIPQGSLILLGVNDTPPKHVRLLRVDSVTINPEQSWYEASFWPWPIRTFDQVRLYQVDGSST